MKTKDTAMSDPNDGTDLPVGPKTILHVSSRLSQEQMDRIRREWEGVGTTPSRTIILDESFTIYRVTEDGPVLASVAP
jgi:hypothetical protein